MTLLPYLVAYGAIGIFVIAVIARFLMWARMPMHLRWELYPVAHEGPKAKYGGSYLEEFEWWTKKRHKSLFSEISAMAAEIIFLVAVKEHNPKLWTRSFPFHFGLYMVIGATALMFGAGLLTALAPGAMEGTLGTLFEYAILVAGVGGLVLGILGALGLLQRRLGDPALKDFTTSADIFNLVFFVVAFGVALANFAIVDRDFSKATAFCQGLITADFEGFSGTGLELYLPLAAVVLLSLLTVYIPLTHMSHFVGKYFAYHTIRWNDEPNLQGGKEEATINALLGQKITWSAEHIQGGGEKSWVDVATEDFSK
jgi:nitrate reductase gamma subunit